MSNSYMNNKFDKFPGAVPAWALDFVRAIADKPLLIRTLFWLFIGESGRHEFWGLIWAIERCGLCPYYESCEWRSKQLCKMPLFWRWKSPIELSNDLIQNDLHGSRVDTTGREDTTE